jgi:hypothetical protein
MTRVKTEDLVRNLTTNAEPVTRLRPPMARAVSWLLLSLTYVAGVVLVVGVRPDIQARLTESRFLLEVVATFMTGAMAAAAAFCAGCPGRPIWERFAPVPFLLVWLASLGEGCWQTWTQPGQGLQVDFVCLPSILAVALVPCILMFVMIRRGAPVAPMTTTALGALASAALGAGALRLFYTLDASVMILVWQFGSVILLSLVAALFGRAVLRWPSATRLTSPSS